jgi:hypothetical protein
MNMKPVIVYLFPLILICSLIFLTHFHNVQFLLKCVEVGLHSKLFIFVIAEIIPRFDDHINDHALLHLIQLRNGQTHLFGAEHVDGSVYFPVGRAASFFGFEVVLLEPR